MGNFNEESVVLKMLARQGQVFSATKAVAKLQMSEIEPIDDIKRGGFTFSDGIGNISLELKTLIDSKFGFAFCSSYQVRMGGVKGVLTYEP